MAASRLRLASRRLRFGLLAVVACAITAGNSLSTVATGDYTVHGPVEGDNAGPAINALLHGDIAGYLAHQPVIGLTSILLRVPFAGLASLLGGGALLTYRLGSLVCLLSLGLFAAWLMTRRRSDFVGWLPGFGAAVFLVVSPAVRDAVTGGHPEDVLAAVLSTCAVIAATRGQTRWAAVMIGAATGAKPWAAVAVPPVLVAMRGERVRGAVIASAVAIPLAGAGPLGNLSAFVRSMHQVDATRLVNPFSFWWPLSSPVHLASGVLAPARLLPLAMTRSMASAIGVSVALGLLALGWIHARRRDGACEPLALLALLGVARCAVDPTHLPYYYLIVLIPLAAWEAVGLGRAPLLTGVVTVAVWLMPIGVQHVSPYVLSAFSIVGTAALSAYLAHRAFHPMGHRPAAVTRPHG
jgi:hypothetical protein